MANDLAPSGERNTPWWYETPSLVSQSSHMTAYTGSNDSNPFDITPSVSSGYFDEDDGSNISDGSFTAHNTATSHNRAGSSWSNSTLTSGRNDVSENGSTMMMMQQVCKMAQLHVLASGWGNILSYGVRGKLDQSQLLQSKSVCISSD